MMVTLVKPLFRMGATLLTAEIGPAPLEEPLPTLQLPFTLLAHAEQGQSPNSAKLNTSPT
jgi:hypothetical protein